MNSIVPLRAAGRSVSFGTICAGALAVVMLSLPYVVCAQVSADPADEVSQSQALERAYERRPPPREAPPPSVPYDLRHRGHAYVAGLVGYTLAYDFRDVTGTGSLAGVPINNLDLENSFVYGAKVGYFFSDHLNWLGIELEGFNTNPHIKQQVVSAGTVSEGSTMRVTTAAFNVIARGQFACGITGRYWYSAPVNRYGMDRPTSFCPLQPYIGVGIGVFFAEASDVDGRSTSNAVPGLNALAGVRYFVTRSTAFFGEYKYNRASFSFNNLEGNNAGIDGVYSASHFVGGISFHFY